ncbi:hypothetical protein [Actinoplanes sp. DH11]|uniref:hypothetical protein n=1 Tax=Actinoplanes sp. DH11 TaxID=2857011 RepID=UPI001E5C67BE|nr:hypothetical protein [Actinoplanes sp. DH11]
MAEKQVLAVDKPLSARPSKLAQYRIADSNLRLYLALLRDVHQLVLRDRTAAARAVLDARWSTWRGNAVEPIVRDALALAAGAGDLPWTDTWEVGGWWNRQSNLVVSRSGADLPADAVDLIWGPGDILRSWSV